MVFSLHSVKVERLRVEDVQCLVQLERLCFTMPWRAEQYAQAFTQKNFAAFGMKTVATHVQDISAKLIAYISFYHAADELEILNIAVIPALRRQGYGRTLLQTALQAACKMGMKKAVLEVRTSNTPARLLYESLGFVCVGQRPRYYSDTGEDAQIYICEM